MRTLASIIALTILLASTCAFQPALPVGGFARINPARSNRPFSASTSSTHHMNNGISIDMTISAQRQSNKPIQSPFFSRKVHSIVKKLRKSFTILLASFAIVLSTTHLHNSPAHASTTITATKTSTTSLLSKLNIFRPRTADELIDKYIQERLFIDDAFDPVESAYREAFSDYPSNGREGVYPQLLAETAASALGRKDGSSLIISKSAASQSDAGGITGALIQASDFLQQKLKVSSSVSYYIIAAGLLLGGTVLPGIVGMSYQAFQRLQIDKSEMKMYGKITDIAAIAKKVTEDDKAGSDEDDDDDADEGEEGENDDDDDDE